MNIKELGLELTLPEMVETSKYRIKVKPYLTNAEIAVIVENALQVDDLVMRNQLINEMVLKICADIDVADADEYTLLEVNGVVSDVINCVWKSYDNIFIMIDNYNQVGETVRINLNKLMERLPDEKGMKSLLNKLTKAITKESTK